MNAGDFRKQDYRRDSRISKKQKLILTAEEKLESKLGYDLFTEGDKRLGWLLTFASVSHFSLFTLQFPLNSEDFYTPEKSP